MWPLLILCVATALAESQTIQKFGCTFVDNVTYMDPDTDSDIYLDKYGAEVDALTFNSVNDLKDWITEIQSIYSHVLQTYLYNTYPTFLEFYLARNRSREGHIEDFFKHYNLKVKDNILSIRLLDSIVSKFRDVKKHCYLVGATEGYHEFPSKNFDKRSLTVDYLAAAIRISVNKRRKGVILMDIDYGYSGPVVIMEDGDSPHMFYRRTFADYVKLPQILRKGTSGEDYNFKLHEDRRTVIAEKINSEAYFRLYYIDRPFCSLSSFLKLEFNTRPFRKILRKDVNGYPVACISYVFLDAKGKSLIVFDGKNITYIKVLNWSPLTYKPYNGYELSDVEEKIYSEIRSVISKMDYDELGSILNLSDEIAKNKKFLKEYDELRKIVLTNKRNKLRTDSAHA